MPDQMEPVAVPPAHASCRSSRACRSMPPPRRPAFALIAAASLAATEARGELPPLSSEAIREAVTGATVHLDTPLGTVLPLHFKEDGSITGAAGSLAFYLGSANDRGRWWVAGGRLCWRWSRWFDAEQSCMQIRRRGVRVEWSRDDGKSGTATIVHKPAPSPPATPVTVASVSPPPPRSAYALGGAMPRDVEAAPTTAPAARPHQSHPRKSPPAPAPLDAPPVRPEAARKSEPAAARQVPAPVLATRPEQQRPVQPPAPPASARATAARPEPPPAPARASTPPPAGVQPSGPLPLPARPAASVAALPAAYRVVGVADSDVLNMRTHPFHAAPIVSVIPPNGRGVHRLGPCQGVWCLVRWQSRTGWVNAIYLEADAVRATVPGSQLVR
jgi:hypothetical protein